MLNNNNFVHRVSVNWTGKFCDNYVKSYQICKIFNRYKQSEISKRSYIEIFSTP